jgi:hypothetical protein
LRADEKVAAINAERDRQAAAGIRYAVAHSLGNISNELKDILYAKLLSKSTYGLRRVRRLIYDYGNYTC